MQAPDYICTGCFRLELTNQRAVDTRVSTRGDWTSWSCFHFTLDVIKGRVSGVSLAWPPAPARELPQTIPDFYISLNKKASADGGKAGYG